MRPIERGQWPTDSAGRKMSFSPYAKAREVLIDRLGQYCSFCELVMDAGLHVEHVLPKSCHHSLKKDWTNFLLACAHCNSVKKKKPVDRAKIALPDQDNTFRAFKYRAGGSVTVAIGLEPKEAAFALAMLDLVGLDRLPGTAKTPAPRDVRWKRRHRAWAEIVDARISFERAEMANREGAFALLRYIVVRCGFWSAWMSIFADRADVRRKLIEWVKGTAADCFDAAANPVPRPGGKV